MAAKSFKILPELDREERIALVNRMHAESEWNISFSILLCCSVLIAGLGLMQNSGVVIIGAMLVAPLMTPLVGSGLALVQGNLQLLKVALNSFTRGTLTSVILGILVELATPYWELSPEILARAAPNILDLFIALFAGISAAYAIARPNLSGALPGVAIAVALIPPLAVTGIAIGGGDFVVALGSSILFLTNVVAIIIGSAFVFFAHGLHLSRTSGTGDATPHKGVNRIIISLACLLLLLTLPLGYELDAQLATGDKRPLAYPLSMEVFTAIRDRVSTEKGVSYLLGARPGADRPNEVEVWLNASEPVSERLIADIKHIVKELMGEDTNPLVVPLQMAPTTQDTDATSQKTTTKQEASQE